MVLLAVAFIRTEKGEIIYASIDWSYFTGDVEFLEAFAIEKGLKQATETGLTQSAIVESAAINAVHLINCAGTGNIVTCSFTSVVCFLILSITLCRF